MFGNSAQGQSDKEPGVGSGVDQNKYLQFTQDRWNDLKNAYVVYHQTIWLALLFYANQSWVEWDDARKVWQPQNPTDEWVPRPRINRFSPTVDAIASNFYQLPEVEAVPKAEDDPEAHTIADICSDLADYAVVHEGLKHQQGQQADKVGLAAQLFVLEGGLFSMLRVKKKSLGQSPQQGMGPAFGYKCDTCDEYQQAPAGPDGPPKFCPECGNPVDPQQTEMMQPQMGPDGQPQMQESFENELTCDIGNCLSAFPRPGSTSLDDSPYLLWAQRHPTDESYNRFGFDAQPDAVWPDGYSVTYEHALNFWYTGYSSSAIQVKDSSMVLEMFVSPKKLKDYPEGFYCAVINDQIAKAEAWDFPEHPLTHGKYLDLPTIFFARSVAFDLCEIQKELNAYESLIKLHAMTSAVDPWVVNADGLLTDITGRSDKVIKYRALGPNYEPPHRAGAGSLDDGVYKQRDNLHGEFQNISMAVNAFRGEQEGAITAASAIQQLRSQAELMFSKPASNWRNFWRETLRKYVKFMQKYFSFEQLAEILGDDKEDDIRAFMAADLDETVDWVASDHGLPRTRDELRQEMMVLFDKGAIDINDPSVRQKIYELFGETGMMQGFNKDATNARLENQAFKLGAGDPKDPTGQYIPPKITPMQPPLEDNAVHLYFHADQVKSRDFKKWNPLAQQALIEHVMETQMLMQPPPMPGQPGQSGQQGANLGDNKNTQGQNPAVAPPTPVTAVQ